ncbi:hypothetical protein [Rheinheimera tilapiae]|jgi:hypothetical protein|uniref:Uncharacterized protein n=1 Tax=Rheinheimera tilapiae TaxID=875043 RepID=A0ABV6BGN7_9GAMM
MAELQENLSFRRSQLVGAGFQRQIGYLKQNFMAGDANAIVKTSV